MTYYCVILYPFPVYFKKSQPFEVIDTRFLDEKSIHNITNIEMHFLWTTCLIPFRLFCIIYGSFSSNIPRHSKCAQSSNSLYSTWFFHHSHNPSLHVFTLKKLSHTIRSRFIEVTLQKKSQELIVSFISNLV